MKSLFKSIIGSLSTSAWLLFSLFFCGSCEEIVDPELPSSSPEVVIDGWVSDQTGKSYVQISRTQNYTSQDPFSTVSGARVEVSAEDSETIFTFAENETPGLYVPDAGFAGVPGTTYQLLVLVNGRTFTATCYMPFPPDISRFDYQFQEGNLALEEGFYPVIDFENQAGLDEYFFWTIHINRQRADFDKVNVISDEDFDGKFLQGYIVYEEPIDPEADTTQISFSTLSEPAFRYYTGLKQLTEVGSPSQAVPQNPPTNLTGRAYGFFNCSPTVTLVKEPQ